jgi:hypothetical protein
LGLLEGSLSELFSRLFPRYYQDLNDWRASLPNISSGRHCGLIFPGDQRPNVTAPMPLPQSIPPFDQAPLMPG